MTEKDKRIVIAEFCGYKRNDLPGQFWDTPHKQGINPYLAYSELPDYLNDLNAMHGAIMKLTKEQLREYRKNIQTILSPDCVGGLSAIDATAAQRAEAFLRAIGKI